MKITFYSNFLTHHQLPFCLEMYKKYGEDFKFVSMEKINQERISLGYKDMDNDYPFVLKAYESKEKYNEATMLAVDSDIVIAGSTPTDDYIKERLKQDKITFRYYARIFYNGVLSIFDFENSKKVYDRHLKYKKNKNLYLLCAMGLLSRNKNIQCRRFIKTKRKRKNRNYLGWKIHKRKTSRICSKTSSKAKRKKL